MNELLYETLYEINSINMKQNETKTGGKFQNNLREVEKNIRFHSFGRIFSQEQRKCIFSPVVRKTYVVVNCPLFLIRVRRVTRAPARG